MTVHKLNRRFMVNAITIDPVRNLISSETNSTEVSPRAIEILQLLVEKNGELVTYKEIEEKIWKGYNSHTSLYQQVANLRKALGDDPGSPSFIKTVSRRGYQFIGTLTLLDEPVTEPIVAPSEKSSIPKWPPGAAVFILLLMSVGVALYVFQSRPTDGTHEHYEQLADAVKQIGKPDIVVAIEIHQEGKSVENLAQLNTIAAITKHHLERKKNLHVIFIPAFKHLDFYERLETHFKAYGELSYVLKPVYTFGKNQSGSYGLEQVTIGDGSTKPFVIFSSADKFAQTLPEFEKLLLVTLKEKNLIDNKDVAVLSNSAPANQHLVDAMNIIFDRFNVEEKLEHAIEDLKKSMASGQNNLIAYSALWDTGLLLMNQQTRYNVDQTLVLMKEKSNIAQRESPDYFKSYYASAEYYCRIQDYDTCAKKLKKTIELKSFDPGVLGNLRFLLDRNGKNQTEVSRINYYLNPFSLNAASFYRNALLSEQRFGDAVQLVNYHRLWESDTYDWYLIAQTRTRIEDLEKLAAWYTKKELGVIKDPTINQPTNNVDADKLPSRYIGYSLLNSGQPNLARYWSQHGSEGNLPYFDVKIIGLLADIWLGQWDPQKWKAALDYADARKEFQNTLDKMYIAYFHFVNGQQNQGGEYLERIFPQLKDSNLVITRDNFRYVIYYNEAKKSIGDHRRALYIEHQLRQYIETLPAEIDRDIDFGIADAEFYALNNNKDLAMASLRTAILEKGWLPNAFWLWPPIEKNPFLKSLYDEPEFKTLAAQVSAKLASLCFAPDCKAQ